MKRALMASAVLAMTFTYLSAHGAATDPKPPAQGAAAAENHAAPGAAATPNLSVQGALPSIAPGAGTDVCASATDAENLCAWDSGAGTHGRKCTLDVEKIDRKAACRYDAASVPDAFDHKPMCFSIQQAEHIAFQSSHGRGFRVRRLVPITATGSNGQACPKHPFGRSFQEEDMTFGSNFDSLAPKPAAAGCKYKLEVQFRTIDENAPAEPHDGQHRHLECRDPHLKILAN